MGEDWDASAAAWLDEQREAGDFARQYVLDGPMQARVLAAAPRDVLDIGCGEGRFCRWLRGQGIRAVGIDPPRALLEAARARDPEGDYREGRAEALDFPDASFDMAVFYLTLIDIEGWQAALTEAQRVLRPGGRILIANLQPYNSASVENWSIQPDGSAQIHMARYLEEHPRWVAWRDMRIVNWHRPLSTYMTALLDAGLTLIWFAEPEPTGGPERKQIRGRHAPYFLAMEWQMPG